MGIILNNDYRVGHLYVREMEPKSYEGWSKGFVKRLQEKKQKIENTRLYDEMKRELFNTNLSEIIDIIGAKDLVWRISPESRDVCRTSIARNMGELFYIVCKELSAGYWIPFYGRTMEVSEKKTNLDRRYTFALEGVNTSNEKVLLGYISFDTEPCKFETNTAKKFSTGLHVTGYHIYDAKGNKRNSSIGTIIGRLRI